MNYFVAYIYRLTVLGIVLGIVCMTQPAHAEYVPVTTVNGPGTTAGAGSR